MTRSRMTRTFEDSPAVRIAVPLWVGLVGPSGSGKTKSALRLATGMQRVQGGDIWMIDTEAKRGLHYADEFKFRHINFLEPFASADYHDAIKHCAGRGAKTIIVDSFSHEWEGKGGVLEMHEEEVQRLAGNDYAKAERMNMLAWQRPKNEHRKLLQSMLQMPINFILCYRAKEKVKLNPGAAKQKDRVKNLGWMPIAPDDFVYEATVNMLLYPGSKGVPSWHPAEMGEKAIVKLPGQFEQIFKDSRPLDEQHGEALANWAAGNKSTPIDIVSVLEEYAKCSSQDTLNELEDVRKGIWSKISAKEKQALKQASGDALRRLTASQEDRVSV